MAVLWCSIYVCVRYAANVTPAAPAANVGSNDAIVKMRQEEAAADRAYERKVAAAKKVYDHKKAEARKAMRLRTTRRFVLNGVAVHTASHCVLP